MDQVEVFRLDDGRFVFFGRVYKTEEELKKGIEDVAKMAKTFSKISKPKSWKIVKKMSGVFQRKKTS